MYAYIKRMCQACPGCALANPTISKSSELVYNFPVKAPFLVMHFDAYAAGKHAGFEGSECYPWLLRHDSFLLYGTYRRCISDYFRFGHHEDTFALWFLPYGCAR